MLVSQPNAVVAKRFSLLSACTYFLVQHGVYYDHLLPKTSHFYQSLFVCGQSSCQQLYAPYPYAQRHIADMKFVPYASSQVAHHMMVYGCNFPGSETPFWSCPLDDESNTTLSVCGKGKRHIIFAWANDASERNLPDGVGLRVGGTTGISYLVIQLHYINSFGVESADTSGIALKLTYERQPQQAGYYVLGNYGIIPPMKTVHRTESACYFNLNYSIYPIGFRTHGHNIAVVTAGYRIRRGLWTELGRMSPQKPQTFYNITSPGIIVEKNDILASRCTFSSIHRSTPTVIGPTNADEMCNFYILYSTFEQRDLKIEYCFRDGDTFFWNDFLSHTPLDASSLHGIIATEDIRHKFNMDPR